MKTTSNMVKWYKFIWPRKLNDLPEYKCDFHIGLILGTLLFPITWLGCVVKNIMDDDNLFTRLIITIVYYVMAAVSYHSACPDLNVTSTFGVTLITILGPFIFALIILLFGISFAKVIEFIDNLSLDTSKLKKLRQELLVKYCKKINWK